ncbi:jg2522 [Pararge aegeria aegeria]|uniref:Jg2522 protein n=1 Tax=Pararge aegeria aegeria TaxID=348720 RepID=A0A8S4RYM9_9NEOP|nr:jg2522 [Pararge aegeria aegeria]
MARWGALIQHTTIWLLVSLLPIAWATPGPCEVETGQSSIIVDIEESRGDLDSDAGVNGLAEYFIIPGDNNTLDAANAVDGNGYFAIPLPHQGHVTVNRSLDYERTKKYLVTIVASDRARDTKQRLSSTTTLIVNVQDDDDQDPSFIYKGCTMHDGACINPEYNSYVNGGVLAGILTIEPDKIQAVDMDTLDARIKYSIESGEPESWSTYFDIDANTGAVRQLVPVDTSIAKKFQLIVKAEEVSEAKRFTTAKLTITVRPVDASPPVVAASLDEGQVEENSPKGTKVLDLQGQPIKLSVSDPDLGPGDPIPKYKFELTTNFFDIDKDGYLIVADDTLDRDAPNTGKFRFQVVAREVNGGAASAPYSLAVKLLDQNDNAPVIPKTQPITVPASLEPTAVYKVEATDIDEGENARISYSIYHVSNNGGNKFTIDPTTGVISSTGRLQAGEQYSVTIRATDAKGLSSQGIVELMVAPGPNTRPPQFSSRDYYAPVSEGAAINSTVTTVTAKDPENEPVTYSIASGNDLRQFAIGSNTGIITVIRRLDREVLTRYQLMVRAEDPGKLSTTATVNIKVTDINDNNPKFDEDSYSFQVKEGKSGEYVGYVHATDIDDGVNAMITYSIPSHLPFNIDNATGMINTNTELDYEDTKVDIQAYDQGDPVMSSVMSLTVYVSHSAIVPPDVRLGFPDTVYTEHVAENSPNGTLVRTLPIWNKKKHSRDTPLKCLLTDATQKGIFYVKLTEERDCAIYLNSSLDYESLTEYSLEIQLESIQGLINPEANKAVIRVHVTDVNDNAPMFIFPEQSTIIGAKGKYFAIATKEMPLGANVLQVKAKDKDSGDFGKIEYRKNAWTKAADEYFTLDADTGVISNIKTFENVPKEVLPFKFNVMARDNPKAEDYKTARASVVINLLQKDNQLIVEVADLNINAMSPLQARNLLSGIEEKSGLVAGLEKLTPRLYLGENGTLESDTRSTNVWLYLLDPNTGEILTRESQPVKKAIDNGVAIQAPLIPAEQPRRPQLAAAPLTTALPAALLALAALVLVAATAATIYICASWNRYKKHKEQALQQYGTLSMSMAPPRPPSGYESSEDEPAPRYETQVLNMAVDDADLQLDFSSNNHAFNFHNVQYLSKDNGERSPTLSETATTARASSVNENGGTLNKVHNHNFDSLANNTSNARNTQTLNRRVPNNHALNNALGTLPRVNNNNLGGGLLAATLGRKINSGNHKKKATQPIMAYDEIPGLQRSTDNDNVIFGKRNFSGFSYEQSPVETTTEL